MPAVLSSHRIQEALADLPGWTYAHAKLSRTYHFRDFAAALVFINQVGALAESHGHHPEIHNTWNKVALSLTTHDAGNQVTEKDVALARALSSLVSS
ncbi:MAG: 4a-hydroxytetrahydrobiopterin dehydratase [Verrucomicrobiota bacterium]